MARDTHDGPPIRRLHGLEYDEVAVGDGKALWRALAAEERVCCRACGGPITMDRSEGQPLWRAAWPTVRCPSGCTLLERCIHLNLWPDV